MKTDSLYEIKEKALDSGRAVFSVQQLANLMNRPKPIANVYLSRLADKGLATRVMRGKISFIEDNMVISTQMVEPAYITMDSALLFHGIIQQIPREVECATTINSKRYKGMGINYHKIPEGLFFGYKRHRRMGSYVFVAEPEKAVIDGLYLNKYSQNDLDEYFDKLDLKRLENFALQFKGRGSKKIGKVVKYLQNPS